MYACMMYSYICISISPWRDRSKNLSGVSPVASHRRLSIKDYKRHARGSGVVYRPKCFLTPYRWQMFLPYIVSICAYILYSETIEVVWDGVLEVTLLTWTSIVHWFTSDKTHMLLSCLDLKSSLVTWNN